MFDQLFNFAVAWTILCIPMGLGVLVAGLIEESRERRGR
jgi:hypothetical protein